MLTARREREGVFFGCAPQSLILLLCATRWYSLIDKKKFGGQRKPRLMSGLGGRSGPEAPLKHVYINTAGMERVKDSQNCLALEPSLF